MPARRHIPTPVCGVLSGSVAPGKLAAIVKLVRATLAEVAAHGLPPKSWPVRKVKCAADRPLLRRARAADESPWYQCCALVTTAP
jgi:hypothetical protein